MTVSIFALQAVEYFLLCETVERRSCCAPIIGQRAKGNPERLWQLPAFRQRTK
jgi:hypothetical protein